MAWLFANVQISAPAVTWILGDPGVSAPTALPMGYVPPLWDNVAPLSNGADMDTFAVPIIVIDDLNAYGPPIANANAPGTFEQPGYRRLMQYGQAVREALRNGGAGITLEGVVATSGIPTLDYIWLTIDKKAYRAVRVAFLVQQRRPRGAL